MKLSFGLFVLSLSLPFLDAAQFRSDYQFSQEADGWFKFHLVPATWPDAQLRCQHEGASLASPTNVQLMKAMGELINTSTDPPRTVFTGIHATYSKGDYFSIEGVPLSKIPVSWAPNEPDNYKNGEECLILHPNDTMADIQCNDTYSYICYRKRTENMPAISECGTIDSGYQFEPRTGSCYKFHNVDSTWSGAFMTCAAEGGYLAIANSPTEAHVFKKLFQKRPKIGTSSDKEIVLLGFRSSENQRYWLTIQGQTLEEAGYSNWAGNEPNSAKMFENDYVGENCGSIDMGCSKIGLNDIWCGQNNPFICEKDPKSLVETAEEQDENKPNLSNDNYLRNLVRQVTENYVEEKVEEIEESSSVHSPYTTFFPTTKNIYDYEY